MEHEIIAAYAQVGIGFAQLVLIGWGLWWWGKDMDRESEAFAKMGQALERQTEALGELLRGQRAARKAPAAQE